MSKCPKCNEEIDRLIECEEVIDYFEVKLDEAGRALLDGKRFDPEPTGKPLWWECPQCWETVADTQDKAIAILVGMAKEEPCSSQ